MKIRIKFILAFLFLLLIPLFSVGMISYSIAKTVLINEVLDQLKAIAATQTSRIEGIQHQNLERLVLVSSRTLLRSKVEELTSKKRSDTKKINQILRDIKAAVPSFKEISVLGLDGTVAASTRKKAIGLFLADEEYFVKGRQGNITDLYSLNKEGELYTYLAGPIINHKKTVGVLAIKAIASDMIAVVRDHSGLGETGETVLAKHISKNKIQYVTPVRFNVRKSPKKIVPKDDVRLIMTQVMSEKKGRVVLDVTDYRAMPVFAVMRYLPRVDWGLTAKIDRAEALAPLYRLQSLLSVVIFGFCIGAGIIYFFFARSIVTPILNLTRVATDISEGDLYQKVDIDVWDEMGVLAHAFNQTTQKLIEANTSLGWKVEERAIELTQSREEIRKLNENLEHKVIERTRELAETNMRYEAEIHDRKRAEQALRSERDRAQQYLDISGAIIVVIDALQNVTLINKRGCEIIGVPEIEVLGKNWFDHFVTERGREEVRSIFNKVLSGGMTAVEYYENAVIAKGGGERIISWRNAFVRNYEGRVVSCLSSGLDITELRRMEEVLKDSREILKTVINSAPVILFSFDSKGIITLSEGRGIISLGYKPGELVGKNVFELYRDHSGFLANIRRALSGENFIKREEVSGVYLETWFFAVTNATGAVTSVVGVSTDVTEQELSRKAEREKSEQEMRFQTSLLNLAREDFSDLETALKKIAEIGAKTLSVERVSVWFFNDARTEIHCEDLYFLSKNSHERGVSLKTSQFPHYIQAIDESRVIAAEDAQKDPRTEEFLEASLEPLGILSKLDTPIRLHGKVVGVVCHEVTGHMRSWSHEEQDFAASISDQIALVIEILKGSKASKKMWGF